MHDDSISRLQIALSTVPDGSIIENRETILTLLTKAWNSIQGTEQTSLFAEKLWRIEELEKKEGKLYFQIERHGGTVNGSSRASLYSWEIDLASGKAIITKETFRQLSKAEKRLDVRPIAQELANSIISKQDNPYLHWNSEKTSCKILISEVIPATNMQTTMARRRRLRSEINSLINSAQLEVTDRNKIQPLVDNKETKEML
ncbi:hypothetical protein MASR2M78_16990 [Treponema sp.]